MALPTRLLPALLPALALLFSHCEKTLPEGFDGPGKRPVYAPLAALNDIKNLPPQPIWQSGAIFLQDTLFFMLEHKKGIHVFNLKDSANIVALTFFQIPAVDAFTISGKRLYADSWRDLLTIDIGDLYNIRLLDRQKDVFLPLLYPPLYQGIFECVDESRGAVVGWEDAELEGVLCRTVE